MKVHVSECACACKDTTEIKEFTELSLVTTFGCTTVKGIEEFPVIDLFGLFTVTQDWTCLNRKRPVSTFP